MSKNFEEEYKEYLNAQAPDLWSRIEAGIDASDGPTAVFIRDNVVPITKERTRKSKKKQNYRRYKLIASIAACLFAIVMIVPVYMLLSPKGSNKSADMTAPMELADATIENSTVAADEAAPESMPMEEEAIVEGAVAEESGVTDVVVALEETAAEEMPEQETADTATEMEQTDGYGVENVQLATGVTEESDNELLQGQSMIDENMDAAAEETMELTIQGAGAVQDNGVLYTTVRLNDVSSAVVKIFVPNNLGVTLENGKSYTVTATHPSDADYYMVISAAMK